MNIKIHHILLLIFTLVLTGCADNPGCNDKLPDRWGCELINGKYSCDEDKDFHLFRDTVKNINVTLKETIKTLNTAILNSPFKSMVHAMLLLYITLYGAMLAGGLVNLTLSDAIVRLMKVAIISLMFTEAGITLYFDIVVKFAIDGGMDFLNFVGDKMGSAIGEMSTLGGNHQEIKELLDQIKTKSAGNSSYEQLNSNTFSAIDSVIARLFSPQSFAIFSALFFTMDVIKNFIALALLFGVFFFILAICRAVYIYVVSLLGRVFLLGMGGIFIIFLLFQRTQHIFLKKWFEQLLGYIFAPVFVFTFISLMAVLVNVVFLDIFKDANGEIKYKVCAEKPKTTDIVSDLYYYWEFQEKKNGVWVSPAIENDDVRVEFFSALVFLGLAIICWSTIESLDNLSTQLFNNLLPDLQTIGKPKNKSLDFRHNIKSFGKEGAKIGGKGVMWGGKKMFGGSKKR